MNRRTMFTAGAAIVATLPLAARAQQSALQTDGTLDPAKAPALLGGTFSKLISQLAIEKSQNEVVRQFAELEVAEANAVAQAFGMPADAPPRIPQDKEPMLEQLRTADSTSFDRMYVDAEIAGHEELRQAATAYLASDGDPMAQGAAMVWVTEIDTHLVMLRSIKAAMG